MDVSLATTDYPDAMVGKLIECSHTHIASKHHRDAHLLYDRSNVRLASATLRRLQSLGRYDVLLVINSINHVVVAMSEVIVYTTIACRNS